MTIKNKIRILPNLQKKSITDRIPFLTYFCEVGIVYKQSLLEINLIPRK